MTICPQPPALDVVPHKEGLMELVEPHLTFVYLGAGFSLMVLLKKGFHTDGATVPKKELEDSKVARKICKFISKHYPGKDYKQTLEYLIGTPFEMPRLLAAIVHDALYGMKWKWRWLCDRIYRKILSEQNYDNVRQEIEYSGIRLIGWKNWKSITEEEQSRTHKLAEVRVVLTRNVKSITEKLKTV